MEARISCGGTYRLAWRSSPTFADAYSTDIRRLLHNGSKSLKFLALPREVTEASKINGLRDRLGKNGFIVLQGFSRLMPKRTRGVGVLRAAGRCEVPANSQIDPDLPTLASRTRCDFDRRPQRLIAAPDRADQFDPLVAEETLTGLQVVPETCNLRCAGLRVGEIQSRISFKMALDLHGVAGDGRSRPGTQPDGRRSH
jgi:hypothetical protein